MSRGRLRIELAPSPALAVAVIALHAAAAFSALAVLPGAAGAALAAALLALGLATAWSRALLKSAASVRALELEGSDVLLQLASGDSFFAQAAERRYVGRFIVSLSVRLAARPAVRRTILVTRDMSSGDSFRRLRIWALWGRLPAVASEPSGRVAAKQLPA